MAALRCERSGLCGHGRGEGAVHAVVDYPELEEIREDHGVQLSCGIQANPEGSGRSFALVIWGTRGVLAAQNQGVWGVLGAGTGGGYTWEKILSAGQGKFREKPESGAGREVSTGVGGAGCLGKVWFGDL